MTTVLIYVRFTGQERFTWMTRVYYKDAHGCVIMFDLSNKNSFINTLKWKKDVDAKCTQSDGSPIPCMLLGNKVSTVVENVKISFQYLDITIFGKTSRSRLKTNGVRIRYPL